MVDVVHSIAVEFLTIFDTIPAVVCMIIDFNSLDPCEQQICIHAVTAPGEYILYHLLKLELKAACDELHGDLSNTPTKHRITAC